MKPHNEAHIYSLRKHPFLLAPRRRMFSQAMRHSEEIKFPVHRSNITGATITFCSLNFNCLIFIATQSPREYEAYMYHAIQTNVKLVSKLFCSQQRK